MTPNFNEYNNSGHSNSGTPLPPDGQDTGGTHPSSTPLDHLKRDRFELLSAYLDGEVTAAERHQVEELLSTDPTMQRLYARLLKLRQGIRNLPAPPASQPVETTVQQVVARIERRPKRLIAWGGVAVAALFVGALIGIMPRSEYGLQFAKNHSTGAQSASNQGSNEGLMIALNHPIVEIPKAAVAAPHQSPSSVQ